ncbi:MAG: hypothetical protein ACOYU3_05440 [Bacillota bacterium]
MNAPIEWLVNKEPWVAFAARAQLLGENVDGQGMPELFEACMHHPLIAGLLSELDGWEISVVSSHKNAGLLMHKLSFLADIGCTVKVPQIARIVSAILSYTDPDGVPRVLMNIPKHFGGTGENQWAWALCDAPVVLGALLKLGVDESLLQNAIACLAMLVRENGWPCAVSPELGKFRGPGRKDDPCPYATLQMLNLLQQSGKWRGGSQAQTGAAALLDLWENSLTKHPYIFYMGNDFRKLKAPLCWYDIVSVADALSKCPWVHEDKRFAGMLDCIREKADENGCFTPESVYKVMKGWDFGQKKEPSGWLTLCIYRIFKRTGQAIVPFA